MPKNEKIQIGRVRSLYLDFCDARPYPRRGDQVSSGKTLYFVLKARKVKRRDKSAPVRIQMLVIRELDLPDGMQGRLLQTAVRGHGHVLLFTFSWYKREKKSRTFEQYMKLDK